MMKIYADDSIPKWRKVSKVFFVQMKDYHTILSVFAYEYLSLFLSYITHIARIAIHITPIVVSVCVGSSTQIQ